jgi:threonine dehydrogenase-like Zn-dependent dehydrogenase
MEARMSESAADQVNQIPDTMQAVICHGPEDYQLEVLDVRGEHLGPNCWHAAIRMLESRRLPMDKICTHQLPLSDFQKGLDLVASGKESIKVSLIP